MKKDPEKVPSTSLEERPDYSGLGTLDSKSVDKSQEDITTEYRDRQEVIDRVSIGRQNCQIVK